PGPTLLSFRDQTRSGVSGLLHLVFQAVSHPSTNQARPCLASEIRRDRAFQVVWP
ncbi:hypothetical protein ANANG_G00294050, partial [Anguilla anguilla]